MTGGAALRAGGGTEGWGCHCWPVVALTDEDGTDTWGCH